MLHMLGCEAGVVPVVGSHSEVAVNVVDRPENRPTGMVYFA